MMMTMMTAMTKAGSALPTPQLPARTIQNPQRQELFTCKLCFGTKMQPKNTLLVLYTQVTNTQIFVYLYSGKARQEPIEGNKWRRRKRAKMEEKR